MKLKILTCLSTLVLVNGCASMNSPSAETIAALSTVQFGETVPTDGAYILHFPAGIPVDTPVSFGGNLFTGEDTKQLRVIPKQDIYAYQDWVSFDRQEWFDAKEKLKTNLQLVLPGYEHPKPGYLIFRLDAQE